MKKLGFTWSLTKADTVAIQNVRRIKGINRKFMKNYQRMKKSNRITNFVILFKFQVLHTILSWGKRMKFMWIEEMPVH